MKTVNLQDIPAKAREFFESLDLSAEEVVLEENGAPRLVLVSPKMLEQRRQAKEHLFVLIDRIQQRNPEVDSAFHDSSGS